MPFDQFRNSGRCKEGHIWIPRQENRKLKISQERLDYLHYRCCLPDDLTSELVLKVLFLYPSIRVQPSLVSITPESPGVAAGQTALNMKRNKRLACDDHHTNGY